MSDKGRPAISVTRSFMPPFAEYCGEIQDLWSSCWLTNMGTKHRQLQAALTEYLDVESLDLLTNGHLSIELSLNALDLSGEVITTPFTFASTTQAIVRNGLTPVFCDIDPVTFTIDCAKVEELITEKTSAIVPVHVYGNICNVEEINRIAQKYDLKILYDAAHAFGVRYKEHGVGSYGDVSCFSFHATKVFHTIEGGAACFRNKSFGQRLAMLKNFGLGRTECAEEIGSNAKLNEFCAAMGLCNLRHIGTEIEKRGRIEKIYRTYLEGISGIQLKIVQTDVEPNYAYFPVIFDETKFGADREEVLHALQENGIMARRYFYPLTSSFPCYHGRYDPERTPVAQQISRRVLCLPMYADLDNDNIDHICKIILGCRR